MIYLATENPGKVREIQAYFAASKNAPQIKCIADLAPEVRARYVANETGTTYAENALIKAQALSAVLTDEHPLIIAEDSGFEVDALAGEPGLYSARYGGPEDRPRADGPPGASVHFAKDDASRCAKILRALENVPSEKRGAKFVACMVLLDSGKNPTYFFGRAEGFVAMSARGDKGFGYDPIFSRTPDGPTWGEVAKTDSHRSRALDLVIRFLGVVKGDTQYPT